ncbi:MAG: hypothetical protein IPK26_03120 [Planctomycetes bacterium]|nr:hypothetical protein [Planctomycetota bacterium]
MQPIRVALCQFVLVAAATAQIAVRPTLIGFTDGASGPAIRRVVPCGPMTLACPTGLPGPAAPAGGLACNGLRGSVWVTQGSRMEERDLSSCQLLCTAVPAHVLAQSVVSGLAIHEASYDLLELETATGMAAISHRHLRSCPPQVVSSCTFALPTARHSAGALAIDQAHGLLFVATSVFGGLAPLNEVLVMRLGQPCAPICRFPVPDCGGVRMGPLQAMTWDPCRAELIVSDGGHIAFLRRPSIASSPCDFREVACCPATSTGADRWFDFDIEPTHPRPVGTACIGLGCRNCPGLRHGTSGDPVVGNPAFTLSCEDGPAGDIAFFAIGFGGCGAGRPFSCGLLYPNQFTVIGAQPLVGSGCSARADVTIPIPLDYALCGIRACSQVAVACGGPLGGGWSLTNALELLVDN